MMTFNQNLYPDGGYLFTDRDGTVLRGDSWRDLEKRIRGYRAINNFSPGDPWTELQVQVCARQPSFCREEGPGPVNGGHHSTTLNQRVINWFIHVIGLKRVNRLPRVDDNEARRRADICARCPRQTSLNKACEACIASIVTSRKAILDGQASLHQNLQPCGALGEDPTIAVHIEQSPSDNPHLPAECWRKQK
jgi:hypothetical protein